MQRLERKHSERFGKAVTVDAVGPTDGVFFGYGLDLSRCIGCRRCVYACVDENNQSRDPQIHWIRVLEFERQDVIRGIDFEDGDAFYDHEKVPAEGKVYLPVACQQCENPECVKACPTTATWTEPDGIVVIDYNWCIGCRYCMAACPYGARHFNWTEPEIPAEELNPNTHYLGNLPRSTASWRSAASASSGPGTAATRPAWKPVPWAPGSSAICSIQTARSDT